ncbi:MAG: hypothetical protein H6546_06975 [Chitinophagales bacterium]|nr:hypothetical protein [Chitinophagales bacterium]
MVSFADFSQDDNTGEFVVDFANIPLGFAPTGQVDSTSQNMTQNILHTSGSGGSMSILGGNTSGWFTTFEVIPASFSSWKEVVVDGTISSLSDVSVSLYDCSSAPVPIVGFQNLPINTAGKVDISSL